VEILLKNEHLVAAFFSYTTPNQSEQQPEINISVNNIFFWYSAVPTAGQ